MKPEFLMLAKVYKNQSIKGWMCSEKLDGTRAFWDGGISKGIPASEVPWANTYKDARLKTPPVATGLWSRSGKVIHAPEWWTDYLPEFFVDGELWIGYGHFQALRSIVARQDGDWPSIRYMAFGCPTIDIFEPRRITVRGDYKFEVKESSKFFDAARHLATPINWGFEYEIRKLKEIGPNDVVTVVEQEEIPYQGTQEFVDRKLERVLAIGGEGLMFRHKIMPWEACRSKFLLKYKPFLDCEVKITGYTSGRLTDRGSKHLGKIGALITEFQGKRLLVSGLTDKERELEHNSSGWAYDNPGKEIPGGHADHFKVGQTITIRYRELSDDGIPKEARFWR